MVISQNWCECIYYRRDTEEEAKAVLQEIIDKPMLKQSMPLVMQPVKQVQHLKKGRQLGKINI
jgi:hypothetical protein